MFIASLLLTFCLLPLSFSICEPKQKNDEPISCCESSLNENEKVYFSDDLSDCFEPFDATSGISVTFDEDLKYLSSELSGWIIGSFDKNNLSISLSSNEHNTSFKLFFIDNENRTQIYQLFCYRDFSNRYFYSKMNQYKPLEQANKYMFEKGEISRGTFEYNRTELSNGNMNLTISSNKEVNIDRSYCRKNDYRSTFSTSGYLKLHAFDSVTDPESSNYNPHYIYARNVYLELLAFNRYTQVWELYDDYYTLENGYYCLFMTDSFTYTSMRIRAYARDTYGNKFLETSTDEYFQEVYARPIIHNPLLNPTDTVVDLDIFYTYAHNQEFWSSQIITHASRYAKYLNDNVAFPSVNIKYYSDTSGGASYSFDYNRININTNNCGTIDGIKSTENWDILGHEYGHHVQMITGFYSSFGNELYYNISHYFNVNHCDQILNSSFPESPHTQFELVFSRGAGLCRAWKEAWPTFFSNCVQKYFVSSLGGIETCCDNVYTFNGGHQFDFSYVTGANSLLCPTDSCEGVIVSFLYHLNDTENDTVSPGPYYDMLSFSDYYMFDLCSNYLPCYFNDFYNFLSMYTVQVPDALLSRLLAKFRLVPNYTDTTVSLVNGLYQIETSFEDKHEYYNYNHIEFSFYTEDHTYLFENISTSNSILLSNSEMAILNANCSQSFSIRLTVKYDSSDLNNEYRSPYLLVDNTTLGVSL